ncbi:MAG TPA: undecaprenyl-diphosphate phosphatase [Gemmatimonadales bacterium]|nr:undecaprenyl-diphosphate phosphatase [Gemmatimonadales bacterium]
MNLAWWQGVLLGLVQGLTEFLPISSSGHLVLAERLVGHQPQGVFFEVAVHVATLLSVFVAYRVRIAELLRGMLAGGRESWRYAGLLLLASLPAALAGVLLRDYFERSFHSLPALGWQFLFTAALLWSTRWALPRATGVRVTAAQALLIGVAQAVAIVPAISRSGATIAVALWCGLAAAPAAEFSFLMSIIVIAGSGLLEARHLAPGTDPFSLALLGAFIAAMLSGIWAIRFLVDLLKRQRFHVFAPYCAALGVLCLVWFGWLGR